MATVRPFTTISPSSTSVSPGVRRLVRAALIAAAIGLVGTGAVLVADPNDQIGAWLQIGAGTGLAATTLRPSLWPGGLVAAMAIAAGLVVGHLADYFGAADSTIGPVAIGLTLVLLVLATTAGVAYANAMPRSRR
jgi:hypothetical protein